MTEIEPLVGVPLGWGLKTLGDYFVARKVETQARRKAAFYILKGRRPERSYRERFARSWSSNDPAPESRAPQACVPGRRESASRGP